MALETVGANGTKVKKGKDGFVRFGFPSNLMGNAAFTGSPLRAYVQDWTLSPSMKNLDITPLGYDGEMQVPDGVSYSGSAKFNFRTDSAALLGFTHVFADILDHGATEPANVLTPFDQETVITGQFFVDKRHYFEATLTLEGASIGGSVGQITSYSVNFKVNGRLTYHRLQADIVES